jgi:hypothetical protein
MWSSHPLRNGTSPRKAEQAIVVATYLTFSGHAGASVVDLKYAIS